MEDGRITVTGTMTVTFVDTELLRSWVERQRELDEERRAFLERYTGIPTVIDYDLE